MQIEYAKVSALGDRQDNQDRAAVVVSDEAALMLVFDGMGGHSGGAKAAEAGLECDDGACIAPGAECGNGVIETGEDCDFGTGNNGGDPQPQVHGGTQIGVNLCGSDTTCP